jgi:TPR repeat protein
LTASGDLKGALVATIAAQQALAERDLKRLAASLRTALALTPSAGPELAELVAAAVRLAEEQAKPLVGLDPQAIEAALDTRTSRGDRDAAYALGRALCGIACGVLAPRLLATGANMRKGVALLLRAADAGREEAWLHLYRMHGDHSLSVANPQMARFCLEKAALGGQVEAQRKLGALMLRAADTLADSEQAIEWLHQAAQADDAHARTLLQSLVLPLDGDDAPAASAIELVRRDDPWLAVRMQLARQFGLTKLEALCVDPADGLRPWGLVVGKNPFISQIRLSAARAIPALSAAAMDVARRAASFFGQASRDAQAFEGDLRRRSLRQRRAFERHGLDESMFFANASSMTLEALRLGPKWAFRAKEPLQLALAA